MSRVQVYTSKAGSPVWKRFGWPDLNAPPVDTSFILGTTKPIGGTNVGVGIIRPYPTRVLNWGDPYPNGTWVAPDVLQVSYGDVVDCVINGRLKLTGTNQLSENNDVRSDPARPVSTGSPSMIDTLAATNATVRYCTVRPRYAHRFINGLGRRQGTYEYNDISGVVDGISPATTSTISDVAMKVHGNHVHDLMFYAPDPAHGDTPPTTLDGRQIDPPWYGTAQYPTGTGWTHCDCCQIEADATTGIEIIGNNFEAFWDPTLSVQPLPTAAGLPAIKELSCLMLNGGRNLIITDNWFDGGEYAINNGDANVTGVIWRNRFGRGMGKKPLSNPTDSQYYALMIAAAGLDTGNGTNNRNVWMDTGLEVPRRAN